jgi:hypothetical protein
MFSGVRWGNYGCLKQSALVKEVVQEELVSFGVCPHDTIHGYNVPKIAWFMDCTGS